MIEEWCAKCGVTQVKRDIGCIVVKAWIDREDMTKARTWVRGSHGINRHEERCESSASYNHTTRQYTMNDITPGMGRAANRDRDWQRARAHSTSWNLHSERPNERRPVAAETRTQAECVCSESGHAHDGVSAWRQPGTRQ